MAGHAKRRSQGWMVTLACVIGVLTTAACATGSWFLLYEGDAPTEPDPTQAVDETDDGPSRTDSRQTDSQPLTVAELFDDGETISSGDATYPVLDADSTDDCDDASTDDLRDLLAEASCSQVVRATVESPDGELVATVGVANLADADASAAVITAIADGVDGGFAALRAGGPSKELGLNPTMLGYNTYGHFLLYVVVGRADGETPAEDDEAVATIVSDLVDTYLPERLAPRNG